MIEITDNGVPGQRILLQQGKKRANGAFVRTARLFAGPRACRLATVVEFLGAAASRLPPELA